MNKKYLNRAQNAMYMMHCIGGMSGLFNNAECLEFSGKVDESKLRQALRYVVSETEVLSSFYQADENFTPYAQPARTEVPIDSCNIPEVAQVKSFFVNWAIERVVKAFDLSRELPVRFYLCRSPSKDYLVTVAHHICLDGFGFMLFFKRIAEVYAALSRGEFMLPANNFRPLEALVTHEQQKAQDYQNAGEFWSEQLAELPAPVSFKPLGKVINRKNIRFSTHLQQDDWFALCRWTSQYKVSNADVLFALILLALYRKTGQSQQSIGMIAMQRFGNPSINIPCLQINTVPLIVDLAKCDNFIAVTKAVSLFKRQSRKHQDYRIEDLKRDCMRQYQREPHGPLVNILPFNHAEAFADLKVTTHNLASGAVEDVMIQAYLATDKTPRIDLDANPNSYSTAELKQIGIELNQLLGEVAGHPELPF